MKTRHIARLFLFTMMLPLFGVLPLRAGPPEAGVKQSGVFFPAERNRRYQQNTAGDEGFLKARNAVVASASPYLAMSYDELRYMVVPPSVGPRSLMVWSSGYCPACGEQVSMYSWEYLPESMWHFSCPHCGDMFPKNDFDAYYRSGISAKTGVFDPALADSSLLFNSEHPDPADPLHKFGVDDGSGMLHDGNTWYFVARAQYSNWQNRILPALNTLSSAYVETGEPEYARRVTVLLDRIADFFPDYDFMTQGYNYEIHQTHGYVTYCIDSAYEVRNMAEAYDRVFDAVKNDAELVSYLVSKRGNSRKKTFADVQRHIEERIFLEALANPDKIRTNFPNTDITVITVEMVLGWPQNRSDIMRRITEMTAETTRTDGTTGEKGLPSYTATALRNLTGFLAKISGLDDGFLPELLRAVPSLHTGYRLYFDTRVWDYYPNIGDATFFGKKVTGFPPAVLTPYAQPSVFSLFYDLYQATGDSDFIRMMVESNGGRTDGLPYDPFRSDAEAITAEAERVISEHGMRSVPSSVDYQNYRLAMLRGGKSERSPVLWISYDNESRSHRHQDLLNMGLYYKNLDLMPDFGYPPVNMGAGWTSEYVQWYTGISSHNTAVCDQRYTLVDDASGVTELWVPGERVQAVTIGTGADKRKSKMTGAQRTAVMVNTAPGEAYVLDVFRARRSGSESYTLFLSAGWGTLETEGLRLETSDNPFLPNVLRETKKAVDVTPGWSAEFTREDYYNYNNPPLDIRLKYTGLSQHSAVYTMEAWAQDNFNDGNVFWVPRLGMDITPERGAAATFVGLLEPYETQSGIVSIKRLAVRGEDNTLLGDEYVAVEVTHADGTCDLLLINDDGTVSDPSPQGNTRADRIVKVAEWNAETDARLLVVQRQKDGSMHVSASTCEVLKLSDTEVGSAEDRSAPFFEIQDIKVKENHMPQIIAAVVAGAIFLAIVVRYVIMNWQKRTPEEDEKEEERRRGKRG